MGVFQAAGRPVCHTYPLLAATSTPTARLQETTAAGRNQETKCQEWAQRRQHTSDPLSQDMQDIERSRRGLKIYAGTYRRYRKTKWL